MTTQAGQRALLGFCKFRSLPQGMLRHLSLARKVALIPTLTMVLMVVMLAVAIQTGEQQTTAMRTLDHDVFEPLNRAQTLKAETTLLHTRLFALLSLGINEADPSAQKANAGALLMQLDATTVNIGRFLDTTSGVLPDIASRLREEYLIYATALRQTVGFAAYDASYGALLARATNDHFTTLHDDLDALVRQLAERRTALTTKTVSNSVRARDHLIGLGVGAALLALLGSAVVGRSIARPVLRLTGLMNRLAGGDTALVVSGLEQRDEVGAMARAVDVFRAALIARREGEVALRGSNLQLDAALNNMLQGMMVWGPDDRLRLVNRRYFVLCGLPPDGIAPGMTVQEVIEAEMRHALHPDKDANELIADIKARTLNKHASQIEVAMRPGLFVRIASQPMADGGAVVTFEDMTEKRRDEEQISFMARHDALTGLANRTLFQEHMDTAVAQLGEGQQSAVLCLDLDHFKEVNDTLGHAAGDELLRQVAGRLRDCVRHGDLIARLGGDEFAIVVASEATGSGHAESLAARLVEAISAPYEVLGHNIIIGTSIGIAIAEPGAVGTEHLRRADVALYRAKEERGSFVFFQAGMDEHLRARRWLETDLRIAIQRGEFELNYQPCYDMARDCVTGFEALIRWNQPNARPRRTGRLHSACRADRLDRSARRVGAPHRMRRSRVLARSCQCRGQSLAGTVQEQTTGRPWWRRRCRRPACPPDAWNWRSPRPCCCKNTDAVITVLRGLHDLGVRISIDDFGTGYSSLSYLGSFPFDKIKIDRSFISGMPRCTGRCRHGGVADTVTGGRQRGDDSCGLSIGLGQNLGISTIAEGVETEAQFARLRQQGCSEVQGYFLSEPRPVAELAALMQLLDATLPAIGVTGHPSRRVKRARQSKHPALWPHPGQGCRSFAANRTHEHVLV